MGRLVIAFRDPFEVLELGFQFLKPRYVIVHHRFHVPPSRGNVRPGRVTGNAGEVQLQLGVLEGILQLPVPIADAAVIVKVSIVAGESLVGRGW
jgi:hypothetical protein